jgi:putative N6-adenine-specific DNA methylase
MTNQTRLSLQLTVAPGLETLLDQELSELGLKSSRVEPGSIELFGSWRELLLISERCLLAEGVRVRVGRSSRCETFEQLEQRIERLPWAAYLERGCATPRVRVSCSRSKLYHSKAVAERVEDVIRFRLSCRPAKEDEPTALVLVRLDRDWLQLSVDACGELYRRGYRRHVMQAPLRETLAAACVRGAGWQPAVPLWDPFCGSGTLLLEAQLWASQRPLGRGGCAWRRWPSVPADVAAATCDEDQPSAAQSSRLIGSDISAKALQSAKDNARFLGELGVPGGEIQWLEGDPKAVIDSVPQGALVLSNPPYGQRMTGNLKKTYSTLKKVLLSRPDLRAALILPSSDVMTSKQLSWESIARFPNRGLPVQLWRLIGR